MQTNRLPISLSICLLTLACFAHSQSLPKPPDTPKHAVADEYQSVRITDDYRWLEDWNDPAVKQWSAAENARTREYLDHLSVRPAIKSRLRQLANAHLVTYSGLQFRAGMLFAQKHQPPLQQPLLVVMRSADDPASTRVIFDPNAASAKGSLAVDFFVPSFGAKYVAAALSQNGSEDAAAHVFEVATGKQLRDIIPRVNFATAGGSIAWKADSSGFYYTRYPQGNERLPEDANFFQQVYFHKLGTDPAQDTYVIGKDFPRIAEIQLRTSDDGRWLLAAVGNGDGGQFAHYLMDADGHWTQLTRFEDGVVSVKFGAESSLYLLSRKDAPRGQILRLPISHLDLNEAKVIVPQSTGGADEADLASIEDFVPAWGRIYVIDIVGGPSRLRVFDTQGKAQPAPVLPTVSAVGRVLSIGGGDVLFYVSTFSSRPSSIASTPSPQPPRASSLPSPRRSSSTTRKWSASSPPPATALAFPSISSG